MTGSSNEATNAIVDLDSLRAAVTGKKNRDIEASVRETGLKPVLDQVFEGMAGRLRTDVTADVDAVVGWTVTMGGERESYTMTVQDGRCRVKHGPPQHADATLRLPVADFLKLVTGNLDPIGAFVRRRLRVGGNLVLASQIGSWFDQE